MKEQYVIKSDDTTLVVTELAEGSVEFYSSLPVDEMTVQSFETWATVEKEDRPALALAVLGEPEDVEQDRIDSPKEIADYRWSDETLLVAARHYLKAYAIRKAREAAAKTELLARVKEAALNSLAMHYFGSSLFISLTMLQQAAICRIYDLETQVDSLMKK